jgi:hypothetical protein
MPQPSPPECGLQKIWLGRDTVIAPGTIPSSPKTTARSSMMSEMQRLIHSALIGLALPSSASSAIVRRRACARSAIALRRGSTPGPGAPIAWEDRPTPAAASEVIARSLR